MTSLSAEQRAFVERILGALFEEWRARFPASDQLERDISARRAEFERLFPRGDS